MTLPATSGSAGLEQLLGEQLDTARSMLRTLEDEHRALLDGDTDGLYRISATKAELVEELESLESARRDLEAGRAQPSSPAVDRSWRDVLEVVEQCREHNNRNGALAKARRDKVLFLLDALGGGREKVYDRNGTVPRAPRGRGLGEA